PPVDFTSGDPRGQARARPHWDKSYPSAPGRIAPTPRTASSVPRERPREPIAQQAPEDLSAVTSTTSMYSLHLGDSGEISRVNATFCGGPTREARRLRIGPWVYSPDHRPGQKLHADSNRFSYCYNPGQLSDLAGLNIKRRGACNDAQIRHLDADAARLLAHLRNLAARRDGNDFAECSFGGSGERGAVHRKCERAEQPRGHLVCRRSGGGQFQRRRHHRRW